ncbi:bifunctional diaminohydroxyphosphoribosylaminopyrimidine deaminase/5-amino-6-(5-phosphoribosylamino)uracil reductase RibD [Pseudoalteromonas fenneropenaei]|uniref:Riboflavin biosynthesis protein RibD n=1 Tax=Pseudoalteromonas fenneropenaei TaxID=1737459 RepID=A0ABV7CIP6_9GAMM
MSELQQFTAQDEQFMRRAIALAAHGQYTTTPNPNVGCVIVKDGEIVGEGFHIRAGEGHAEVHALKAAGDKAKGATAYVTLEPCSHYGRTPPCAEGLIKAGVSKVIAAMVDNNPQVAGKGMAMLSAAGIETAYGLLGDEARALNLGFFKRMATGMPYVTCKLAASLDGKTALENGESKWITGPLAREDVQRFRAKSCAIISGADTILADDAQLSVRSHFYPELQDTIRQPLRVIFDSQNRLTPDLALFQTEGPVLLLRNSTQPLDNSPHWPHFVEQCQVESRNGKICPTAVLKLLARRGINHVWLEAGQTLAGVFHEAGLIDSYVVYLAPKIIGNAGRGLFAVPPLMALAQATTLTFSDVVQIGSDLRITALK